MLEGVLEGREVLVRSGGAGNDDWGWDPEGVGRCRRTVDQLHGGIGEPGRAGEVCEPLDRP